MTKYDEWKRKAIANSQAVNEGKHTCHYCGQEFANGYEAAQHDCYEAEYKNGIVWVSRDGKPVTQFSTWEAADAFFLRARFKDVLDFLASDKCNGACLYWQMPNPFRGRDAAAAGAVREVDDLLVHPDAIEIEKGMAYTMEKKS